jgi:hypothetical protein
MKEVMRISFEKFGGEWNKCCWRVLPWQQATAAKYESFSGTIDA